MISVRGRGPARFAAAAIATGMLAAGAMAGAGTAVADELTPHKGGATATLGGLNKDRSHLAIFHDDGDKQIGAGLFDMTVDGGGALQTYCIDINTGTRKEAKYKEASWAESSLHDNENAGKILWILKNSYPQVDDLAALANKAGAEQLTEKTAAAGTQVAIWRFSDDANVSAKDANAEKLADYLEKNAQNLAEPTASLTLDPPAVSGKAGEKLGPITVHTNAQEVTVAPGAEATGAGVKVVGKDGNVVTSAKEGDQLFFDVPKGTEPGTASLTLQASTEVSVGRAFTSVDPKNPSQTQILAGSSGSSVSATATATWANEGPIPAVTAEKNCAKGGVDVTATNEGDEPFSFSLAGKEYEIPAGGSETVTVPVQEDQEYNITITGPNGFKETFTGTLDCETAEVTTGGNGGEEESPKPSTEPSPATVGGDTGDTDGNLAETGSSSTTPIIAGVALTLVVLGGAAVFFLRKKKPATAGSND
ncbi:Cys-Gln thioester bond-forming surface protein [Streptomyces radiopugnans]|uniref:LPXTG-motif cell wall anchor domain-containing protein/TQXA domain-containing protein n=1 Tax=Streptomyces radiopugnans TaxID=403935 RepID=A0A1H8YZL1_9ACTN|nr:Cys-Gln thioester bond-forming surface protein [Streptomyces radiopugnans]SEP57513.1 LPXTG-motif cell wall anchor domain-containing protein/TQXA domain-containing protein [Streptomyces radiopugnans]